ncbi:unnamed protein product [Caretta caretta]
MIEVVCNDRLGKKVRVKCNTEDTIGDLKKLIAAQTGTRWDKIVLKKWEFPAVPLTGDGSLDDYMFCSVPLKHLAFVTV